MAERKNRGTASRGEQVPSDQTEVVQDETNPTEVQTGADPTEADLVETDQGPLYQVHGDPAFPGPGAPEPVGPRAALRGNDLERAASEKVRDHFEQIEQTLRDRGLRRQVPNMMWVKSTGLQPVPDGQGGFFTDEPMQVPVDDVYVNRRIRDGSMAIIHGGPDAGPVGVLMRERPDQPAPPEAEENTE